MMVWVFTLMLNLPSFGGDVTATIHATTEEACQKIRHIVIQQFGGDEKNINGSITPCTWVKTP